MSRVGQQSIQGGASSKISASTWKEALPCGGRMDDCQVDALRSRSNEVDRDCSERK